MRNGDGNTARSGRNGVRWKLRSPFCVMDCSLIRCTTGRACSNLRELLEAIRTVSDAVLEHHMMRCALEDHFELYEFPNDLARWCWSALGDNVLGEQLGPGRSLSDVAVTTPLRIVAGQRDRGSAVGTGPRAVVPPRPGTAPDRVAADRLRHGRTDSSRRRPCWRPSSACRRGRCFFTSTRRSGGTAGQTDDFSTWLERLRRRGVAGGDLRGIDFYFLNLSQLRQAVMEAFRHYIAEAPPVARSVP